MRLNRFFACAAIILAALLSAPAGGASAATRYKVFVSHGYNYRIAYAASWKHQDIPGGQDTYEVFTAPAVQGPKGPYRASVSILVERAPAGMSLAAFVKTLVPTTATSRVHVDRQVATHVAGQGAVLLYGTVAGQVTTRFINAVFLARGETWRIILVTLPNRLKADQPILMHMLGSLRLGS